MINLINLANIKLDIAIYSLTQKGLMYIKMTIADNSTVTTGYYNYTQQATSENDYVLVVIQDPTMAKRWDNEFNTMLGNNASYRNCVKTECREEYNKMAGRDLGFFGLRSILVNERSALTSPGSGTSGQRARRPGHDSHGHRQIQPGSSPEIV